MKIYYSLHFFLPTSITAQILPPTFPLPPSLPVIAVNFLISPFHVSRVPVRPAPFMTAALPAGAYVSMAFSGDSRLEWVLLSHKLNKC